MICIFQNKSMHQISVMEYQTAAPVRWNLKIAGSLGNRIIQSSLQKVPAWPVCCCYLADGSGVGTGLPFPDLDVHGVDDLVKKKMLQE